MKITIKRPSFQSQWAIFTTGIYVPFILVLLGNWMISTGSAFIDQVSKFLDQVKSLSAGTGLPFIYEKVLIPLNSNQGLWYSILGLLVMLLAVLIAWYTFRKVEAQKLELGKIKLSSLVMSALVTFIIVLVMVAILNDLLYTSLVELQSAVSA